MKRDMYLLFQKSGINSLDRLWENAFYRRMIDERLQHADAVKER